MSDENNTTSTVGVWDLISGEKAQAVILANKEAELKKARIEEAHEDLVKKKEKKTLLKSLNIGGEGEDYINSLQKKITDYFESIKKSRRFINSDFGGIVPYFEGNLILLGANTGDGKSTTVANICLANMEQRMRTLVISTEEKDTDVFNRITSLVNNINYADHDKMHPDDVAKFRSAIPSLSKLVSVVDNNYNGMMNATTTLEGLTAILNSLLEPGAVKFDCIIIDYIQKIIGSEKIKQDSDWVVLKKVMDVLDDFKNKYAAPILVFSQLHPHRGGEDAEEAPFEDRIKGYKGILVPVTCAIEISPNKAALKTEWVLHKSRWQSEHRVNESRSTMTGWMRGRFTKEDDPEFIKYFQERQARGAQAYLNKAKPGDK